MKKIIYSVCVFCLVLSSCSNSPKTNSEAGANEVTTNSNPKHEAPQVIELEENITNYVFKDWTATSALVPSENGIKVLGLYDENNDIISLEEISFGEVFEIIKDRKLSEPIKIIMKIQREDGQIVDYIFTKE